jgi:hypothetical protein
MGECGLRGGYVQFDNLDPQVYVHYKKMISAKLCSTVLGQVPTQPFIIYFIILPFSGCNGLCCGPS